jgi:hypothetical protein
LSELENQIKAKFFGGDLLLKRMIAEHPVPDPVEISQWLTTLGRKGKWKPVKDLIKPSFFVHKENLEDFINDPPFSYFYQIKDYLPAEQGGTEWFQNLGVLDPNWDASLPNLSADFTQLFELRAYPSRKDVKPISSKSIYPVKESDFPPPEFCTNFNPPTGTKRLRPIESSPKIAERTHYPTPIPQSENQTHNPHSTTQAPKPQQVREPIRPMDYRPGDLKTVQYRLETALWPQLWFVLLWTIRMCRENPKYIPPGSQAERKREEISQILRNILENFKYFSRAVVINEYLTLYLPVYQDHLFSHSRIQDLYHDLRKTFKQAYMQNPQVNSCNVWLFRPDPLYDKNSVEESGIGNTLLSFWSDAEQAFGKFMNPPDNFPGIRITKPQARMPGFNQQSSLNPLPLPSPTHPLHGTAKPWSNQPNQAPTQRLLKPNPEPMSLDANPIQQPSVGPQNLRPTTHPAGTPMDYQMNPAAFQTTLNPSGNPAMPVAPPQAMPVQTHSNMNPMGNSIPLNPLQSVSNPTSISNPAENTAPAAPPNPPNPSPVGTQNPGDPFQPVSIANQVFSAAIESAVTLHTNVAQTYSGQVVERIPFGIEMQLGFPQSTQNPWLLEIHRINFKQNQAIVTRESISFTTGDLSSVIHYFPLNHYYQFYRAHPDAIVTTITIQPPGNLPYRPPRV